MEQIMYNTPESYDSCYSNHTYCLQGLWRYFPIYYFFGGRSCLYCNTCTTVIKNADLLSTTSALHGQVGSGRVRLATDEVVCRVRLARDKVRSGHVRLARDR